MTEIPNDNDPPHVEKNGIKIWLDENGFIHRDIGPAVIFPSGASFYFHHGEMVSKNKMSLEPADVRITNEKNELHCENAPALISYNGRQEWWLFGKRHRFDGPAIVFPDGSYSWWLNGVLHRLDGPAIYFANCGGERWYRQGKLHREDGGPAKISLKGYLINYKKWFRHGQLHREDGPAVIGDDGSEKWYKNGQLHREEGPAIIHADGSKEFFVNGRHHRKDGPAVMTSYHEAWIVKGKLHREEGPALTYKGKWEPGKKPYVKIVTPRSPVLRDVREAWFRNGKCHREDGPALIRNDGTEIWVRLNKYHREDGPAVNYPNGSCEWWRNGKLHREDGPAVIVSPGHFIFYAHRILKPEEQHKEIIEKNNDYARQVAKEIPLDKIMDTHVTYSQKGREKREQHTYHYIGRGKRVLSDQYWQKGKFIKQDDIPKQLQEHEDPQNQKNGVKEVVTYQIDTSPTDEK